MAGKWRVLVDIGSQEATMLKFQHEPALKEVQDKTAEYIVNLEQAKIAAQKEAVIDGKVEIYRASLVKADAEPGVKG